MRKSSDPHYNFRNRSLRASSGRHILLLQMAKDAEQLAAQGRRLKELRARKRVSQETAAYEIGVSTRAYRNWEGGGGIKDGNVPKVAEYFAVSADFLEYGHERGPVPDLMANLSPDDLGQRLDRMEDALNEIREMLVDADVVRLDAADRKQTGQPSRPARRKKAA